MYKLIVGSVKTPQSKKMFEEKVMDQKAEKKLNTRSQVVEWWEYLGGPSISDDGNIVQAFIKRVNHDPDPFD